MHELTVTESILEIALRHAKSAGAAHITDLYLVIGQLSSVVGDSVQFYWDIVSQNTAAEGARLHFKRVATELVCLTCGKHYASAKAYLSGWIGSSQRLRRIVNTVGSSHWLPG